MTDDRPPPNDLEAEAHVLGSLLADPEQVAHRVQAVLTPEDFYSPAHQDIYRAFLAVDWSGGATIPVKNELHRRDRLALAGHGTDERDGVAYLLELATDWGHRLGGLLPASIEAVKNTAMLRKMMSMAARMTNRAKAASPPEAGAVVDQFQRELYKMAVAVAPEDDTCTAGEAIAMAIEHGARVHRGEAELGLSTGYPVLDTALAGGFHPGDLVVLAGATSVGKSAFGLCIAQHMAGKGLPVLIVSVEMHRQAIGYRLLQASSAVASGRLRSGNLNEHELNAQTVAAHAIHEQRIAIVDRVRGIDHIRNKARALAVAWNEPPALVLVDYLQLLRPSNTGAERQTRAQQVGGMAWAFKELATDLGTSVLLLSQLSRAGVTAGLPSLYTLKESGDVENHSDAVLLLHKPQPLEYDNGGEVCWLKVAKARDGMTTCWPSEGTGGIRLRFRPEITRFESMAF